MQKAGLDRVQPPVITFNLVEILGRLAVITQDFDLVRNTRIISSYCPSFATRSEVFSGVEAECSRTAHRAGFHPAILLPGEILCAVCLTCILNHHETVLFGKAHDGIHVGHLAVKMHWHDCCDRPSTSKADKLA